jgi:hypothetical protein
LKKCIYHAVLRKTTSILNENMTYLLWTRCNVDGKVGLHAIYFTDGSGIRYSPSDNDGEFWKMPWAMTIWIFPDMKEAVMEFTSKIAEKLAGGYIVTNAGCEVEDCNEVARDNGARSITEKS